MQVHLFEDGGKARLRCTHVDERAALVGRERMGAGELDQEQVVLHKVGAERGLRQGARPHLAHEVVVDVALPVGSGRRLQPVEDVHRIRPSLIVAKLYGSRFGLSRH